MSSDECNGSVMATDRQLGTRIKRARERKRLSQQELADALGVSRSAVNAWETGRAYPRSAIGALEDVLGIDLSDADGRSATTSEAIDQLQAALDLLRAEYETEKKGRTDHESNGDKRASLPA